MTPSRAATGTRGASGDAERLRQGLSAAEPSERLRTAMGAGTHPDASYLEPLLARCAIEPDFYVRDMLTWALTRLPREPVLRRVIAETASPVPQARSQALHTLTKLRDARGWDAITVDHLHDSDIEVARTAWRAAAGLAPEERRAELARELLHELGRGELDTMRSLSRAFVELGPAATRVLESAAIAEDELVARHARATLRLMEDPEAAFHLA